MNEEQEKPNIAEIANPYDFANPVSRKDLFIGRASERKDIEYYLNHAKNADRSINLALLGERAAGKTSLLNIIEIEAVDRGLVPVRIDLNESDVETHFAFWFKLFDAVVNRISAEPNSEDDGYAFGGTNGKTYDTYLDLITAYEIPEDKTFCPFQFPIQYAKAMGAGNSNARVSDQILKRDLKAIATEVGRPIVLLIDECNILSAHRSLLEMVRNTFMNLAGYMLVFTGTPDLFPLMDEVFSPIVRQFKRIEVTPFADIRETRKGVLEPLNAVDHEELYPVPDEEFFESAPVSVRRFLHGDLHDLHALTGGRPYEIQLVCHFMFRRVQRSKDQHMRLSFDVLEDVLRELRQSHDVDARPVISAVKGLELDDLACLQLLLTSAGKVAVEQLVFAFVTTGKTDLSPKEITESLKRFVELEILIEGKSGVRFKGDDFDRIVCKYAARQRKTHLSFEHSSVADVFESQILRSITDSESTEGRKPRKRIRGIFALFSQDSGTADQAKRFGSHWPDFKTGGTFLDVCRSFTPIISECYPYFAENEEDLSAGITLIRVYASHAGTEYTGFLCRAHNDSNEKALENCLKFLEAMKEKARSLGGVFDYEFKTFGGAGIDDLFDVVAHAEDESLLRECVDCHESRAFHDYVDDNARESARQNALRVAAYARFLNDDSANNIGYILLSLGQFEESTNVLETLLARQPGHMLGRYNCAVSVLQQSKIEEAKAHFAKVVARDDSESRTDVGVLLIPQLVDGSLSVEESWAQSLREDAEPDHICLADAARAALEVCEQLGSVP